MNEEELNVVLRVDLRVDGGYSILSIGSHHSALHVGPADLHHERLGNPVGTTHTSPCISTTPFPVLKKEKTIVSFELTSLLN